MIPVCLVRYVFISSSGMEWRHRSGSTVEASSAASSRPGREKRGSRFWESLAGLSHSTDTVKTLIPYYTVSVHVIAKLWGGNEGLSFSYET